VTTAKSADFPTAKPAKMRSLYTGANSPECRLMHAPADGEVGHQQAPELLPYQLRRFASEHDLRTAQMCLQLVSEFSISQRS